MTLIFKLDLDMVTMYLHAKNKVSMSRASKVITWTDRNTDTHTDTHTHTHTHTHRHTPYTHTHTCIHTFHELNISKTAQATTKSFLPYCSAQNDESNDINCLVFWAYCKNGKFLPITSSL